MLQTRECYRVNEFVANTSSPESQRQIGINFMSIGFQLSPLERKNYVERDHENAAERALRAKKRQVIERAELEAAEKKKSKHRSSFPIKKNRFQ